MSEQAGTTARSLFEQRCHKALTNYQYNLGEYPRKQAYDLLIGELLAAGDRYALGAEAVRRGDQIRARDLDAALKKVMTHA